MSERISEERMFVLFHSKKITLFFIAKSLFLSIFVTIFSASITYACMMPKSVDRAIKEHEIIFTGRVIGCFYEHNYSYVKFKVYKIWKGEIEEFYTSPYDCSGKSFFKENKNYLVYAMSSKNTKHIEIPSVVGDCSRTSEIVPYWMRIFKKMDFNPKDDMKVLGEPIHVFKEKSN